MSETAHLPVIEFMSTQSRRALIDFALTNGDTDTLYTKRDLSEKVGYSTDKISNSLGTSESLGHGKPGPLVEFGIFETVGSDDATMYRYKIANSDVTTLLKDSPFDLHEFLTIFEKTGRKRLISFFLDGVDPTKQYSKNKLSNTAPVSYQTVNNYIDELVELGVVIAVEGPRGPQYQRNNNSELLGYMVELNEALVDEYYS